MPDHEIGSGLKAVARAIDKIAGVLGYIVQEYGRANDLREADLLWRQDLDERGRG